jgi:tetratricopeptide (TPR) repeat protein
MLYKEIIAMRISLFRLLFLLLAVALCPAATVGHAGAQLTRVETAAPPVPVLLARAQAAFDQADYAVAETLFAQATVLAPRNAVAWAGKARCEAYLEEDSAAIVDYTTAIHFAPTSSIYYMRRGISYEAIGDGPDALADYSTAIRLAPTNPDTWFNRGSFYYNQGQYARSIPNYTQAIRLNPIWWQAYYNRGQGERWLSQDKAAIADFTIYITHTPRPVCSCAFIWRGLSYDGLKQYAKALADYQEAIVIGPPANPQYYDAGMVSYRMHLYAQADRYLTQAIFYLPTDAPAHFYRANARLATGDKPGALADLKQAVLLYTQQGDVASAKRAADELARLEPKP